MPASRERLYTLCAEADELARWWGPAGFTIPAIDFDPRVGASYRIAMQPPEGEVFHLAGEFRAVEPPSRLAYTFKWEEPDPDDQETLVELMFTEADDGTELALVQGPFATEARLELHRNGWSDSFVKIERLLSNSS